MSAGDPLQAGDEQYEWAEVREMVLEPTQVRNPWRATARTVIQTVPAVALAIPLVVDAVYDGNDGAYGPIAVGALFVSGVVTRVMALKPVNDLLTRFGLGADPKYPKLLPEADFQ